jgi:hypothetical protein
MQCNNTNLLKKVKYFARFEGFTAVKIQIKFFWVVTSCRVVAGYQRFRGSYYLHL